MGYTCSMVSVEYWWNMWLVRQRVRLVDVLPNFAYFITCAIAIICLRGAPCMAQEGQVSSALPEKPYTLHVYQDLIQLPSLVMDVHGESYRGLNANDFSIRLDHGPPFHPVHLRVQGDDPVSFAVLLDVSRDGDTQLVTKFKRAVSDLPPGLLEEHDQVWVYAFDCNVVRSSVENQIPADMLKAGVAAVLDAPTLHGSPDAQGTCRRPVPLRDAMTAVLGPLSKAQGRRVLLVVTDGQDDGGRKSWEEVGVAAGSHSVAIFGLRPFWKHGPLNDTVVGRRVPRVDLEDSFARLCANTGGLAISEESNAVPPMLRHTLALMRGRYVLEFPRATNETAGVHFIEVAVARRGAVVRASGITLPVQDKTLLKDPSTVPADTRNAPTMGSRGMATPH